MAPPAQTTNGSGRIDSSGVGILELGADPRELGSHRVGADHLDAIAEAGQAHRDHECRPVPDLDLDRSVTTSVDAWSVRWVLLHLISETARHAGCADIVREMIDGATAFPLMAAVEGWPATDWMQPWEPAR
jgi:hypothetical protein